MLKMLCERCRQWYAESRQEQAEFEADVLREQGLLRGGDRATDRE
jgi:hypothetical protein